MDMGSNLLRGIPVMLFWVVILGLLGLFFLMFFMFQREVVVERPVAGMRIEDGGVERIVPVLVHKIDPGGRVVAGVVSVHRIDGVGRCVVAWSNMDGGVSMQCDFDGRGEADASGGVVAAGGGG